MKNFEYILQEYNNDLDSSVNSLSIKYQVNRKKLTEYFKDNGIIITLNKNQRKYIKALEDLKNSETENLTSLALKYNFSSVAFSNWLKRNNYNYKSQNKSSDIMKKQYEGLLLYKQGDTIASVCKKLNISEKSFSLYLRSKNIKIRNSSVPLEKYYYNQNFFNKINTEDNAYWFGFIYADGSITRTTRRNRLVIELNEIDYKHIEKFKKAISTNVPIKKRKNRNICSITINNQKIVNDLCNLGCVPKKTCNGTFNINILFNKNLICAFLRGYLDGDGYIEKNLQKNRVIFTMKTLYFANVLLELINSLGIYGRIENCNSYHRVAIERKKDFYEFLYLLYGNATIYLDRKYEIYLLRSRSKRKLLE